MARSYTVDGTVTNTASATLPLLTLIGSATIRPKLYDIIIGSDATPADNAAKYVIQRCTSSGTAGSTVTPVALDPGDPAAIAGAGLAVFSAGPILTTGYLLQMPVNQRATFRWVAAPTKEIIAAAAANNGIALLSLVVGGSAFSTGLHISFEE